MAVKNINPQTIAVQAGLRSDKGENSLIPPIHLSSTYALEGLNKKSLYEYSRTTNPTRDQLAKALALIEYADNCAITNTGMSAILLVLHLLTKDDLLIVPHDCYGGSLRLFLHLEKLGHFKLLVIDQNNSLELDRALSLKPKMLWLETPSNPLLNIYDIRQICNLAKQHNVLVAVDNTFLSPILQNPLQLGADIVVHSCTKFINGHSDIVLGAVMTNGEELGTQLAWLNNCLGLSAGAFDCYMVMRGLRTLPLRMLEHENNTHKFVDFLSSNPKVNKIYYPGLEQHQGHEIAKTQQKGFGSLVSIELKGGEQSIKTLFENLKIFTQAQSLGGVESLVNHPYSMTHASMSEEAKKIAGVTTGLVRLSIGVEFIDDLIADFSQALAKIKV